MGEAITMVEMENRLKSDADGTYRDATLGKLDIYVSQLKKSLDTGLSPADYQIAQRALLALETATLVIERVWKRHHHRHPSPQP